MPPRSFVASPFRSRLPRRRSLQDLVAGILRAMGYETRVSGPGADRGVDIFASPDGLGLQEPRIFVEVKHRVKSAMGSQEVRSFLGEPRLGDPAARASEAGVLAGRSRHLSHVG